jgi:hypothetical protein
MTSRGDMPHPQCVFSHNPDHGSLFPVAKKKLAGKVGRGVRARRAKSDVQLNSLYLFPVIGDRPEPDVALRTMLRFSGEAERVLKIRRWRSYSHSTAKSLLLGRNRTSNQTVIAETRLNQGSPH